MDYKQTQLACCYILKKYEHTVHVNISIYVYSIQEYFYQFLHMSIPLLRFLFLFSLSVSSSSYRACTATFFSLVSLSIFLFVFVCVFVYIYTGFVSDRFEWHDVFIYTFMVRLRPNKQQHVCDDDAVECASDFKRNIHTTAAATVHTFSFAARHYELLVGSK